MERVACELCDLPCHLDAGRPTADDHERQPRCALLRIALDLGRLEGGKDAGAKVERTRQRLQLGRVLGPLVVAEVRVGGAAGHDELVVVERRISLAVREVVEVNLASGKVEAGHLREQHVRVCCRRRIRRSGEAISAADSAPVATW